MESNKKLALLGASSNIYKTNPQEIINRYGYVWTGWTYQLHDEKMEILDKQIVNGVFHIYVYIIKSPSNRRRREGASNGSGLVEYRLIVKSYRYYPEKARSPRPECSIKKGVENETVTPFRLWVYVIRIEDIKPRKWNTFKDYQNGEYLKKFNWNIPNAYLGYVNNIK